MRRHSASLKFTGPTGNSGHSITEGQDICDGPATPGDAATTRETKLVLGRPLSIRQVAVMLGCSVWTVRQTLIPKGLPVFRSSPAGKLIFFESQVAAWVRKFQVEVGR
jgi:hypothetical protein